MVPGCGMPLLQKIKRPNNMANCLTAFLFVSAKVLVARLGACCLEERILLNGPAGFEKHLVAVCGRLVFWRRRAFMLCKITSAGCQRITPMQNKLQLLSRREILLIRYYLWKQTSSFSNWIILFLLLLL